MRTTYWLPCDCGRRLPVETTQAGVVIRCACGAELTVPTLHEMSRLESTSTAMQSPAHRPKPIWSKRQRWIFLGAVVTATAAGLLVYLEITRPRIVAVESLAPIQVWSLWQDLRRGPDRHLTPPQKQFLDHLHMYDIWRMVFVVGVVLGVLLMTASYVIPAPRTSRQAHPGRGSSHGSSQQ